MMQEKAQLRKSLRRARRDHVAAQPAAIQALLFNRPPTAILAAIAPDSTIGLYHPTADEAPTQSYAQFFLEAGHTIALPRFATADAPMRFARHTDPLGASDLAPGPFGVLQPATDAPVATPDVLFVPLLGFTAGGDRLGQGGGHYDRWLAAHPAARAIGLAWDVQQTDALPLEPHDRRLHMIVTPTRIYDCEENGTDA